MMASLSMLRELEASLPAPARAAAELSALHARRLAAATALNAIASEAAALTDVGGALAAESLRLRADWLCRPHMWPMAVDDVRRLARVYQGVHDELARLFAEARWVVDDIEGGIGRVG